MILEELVTLLGFKSFGEDQAKKYEGTLRGIAAKATLLTGVAIATATALGAIAKKIAEPLADLDTFSKLIGANVEQLQRLKFAAGAEGVGFDSLKESLTSISSKLSEANRGVEKSVDAFGLFGISIHDSNGDLKDATTILSEVSDVFASLPNEQRLDFAKRLGISSDLIPLLSKGSAELERIGMNAEKLGGMFTQEQTEQADKFLKSLYNLTFQIKSFGTQAATKLFPVLTKIIDSFVAWDGFAKAVKLASWALGIFLAIQTAQAMLTAGAWLTNMYRAIKALTLFQVVTKGISFWLAIVDALALLIPLTILAGIAAWALLVEDVMAHFDGKKSFTGLLIMQLKDAFAWVGKLIDKVIEFKNLITTGVGDKIFEWSEKLNKDENVKTNVASETASQKDGSWFDSWITPKDVGAKGGAAGGNIDASQTINAEITVQGGPSGYQTGREIAAGLTDQSKILRRNTAGATAY